MNTTPSPTRETEEEKRRRSLLPLFLLLLFFLLATSCIVGFLLGRTTEPGRFGALIDTIVLSPEGNTAAPTPSAGETPAVESPAAEGLDRRFDLVGTVRYTDGTPFTQGSVRLQSEPRYSGLTDRGRFRFDQVETGTHELTVLDSAGNELAHRTIEVERDAGEKNSHIKYTRDLCLLYIKLFTVEVDIEVTLGDEPGGLLDVELVETLEEDGPDFRPSAPPPAETQAVEAGVPTQLPVTAPPEETAGVTVTAPPTESPVIPTLEPTAVPTAEPTAAPTVSPTTAPTASPTAKPTAEPSAAPSREPEDDDDDDDDDDDGFGDTPQPPAPPAPVTGGDTEVYHGSSAVSWTQQSEIDLFRPLEYADQRVIAPGSKGYYVFRLKNGRNEAVRFTMGIREGNFHVPLKYRIATDEAVPTGLTEWQTASVDAETVSGEVPMEANGEKRYRIEWIWPSDGDDTVDTALGQRDDRTYTVKLTIHVEGEG